MIIMKRIITLLLIIITLFQINLPAYATIKIELYETFISPRCKINDKLPEEKQIWNLINKYSPNEYITAGIMGMYYRESNLQSDAVGGYQENNNKNINRDFHKKIDAGLAKGKTKKYFIEKINIYYGGYGLCQWCWDHIPRLYDFAREYGAISIADAEMQIAFTFYEIKEYYPDLWEVLLNTKSAYKAGSRLATYYDGTGANWVIGNYAKRYYNRYAKK